MNYTIDLSTVWTAGIIAAVVWEFFWKGLALWRAAKLEQPIWFVVLMLVNSLGILPIIYLLTHHSRPSTTHGFEVLKPQTS